MSVISNQSKKRGSLKTWKHSSTSTRRPCFVNIDKCLRENIIAYVHISSKWVLIKFFVCFVALRPKSTAMVMVGRSVHLTTLFPGQAWTSSKPVLRAHTFACNWQQPFLNDSVEGRRMTVEIVSWSISMKVWDQAWIELATPRSAVRLASVARHVTNCATRPVLIKWQTTTMTY